MTLTPQQHTELTNLRHHVVDLTAERDRLALANKLLVLEAGGLLARALDAEAQLADAQEQAGRAGTWQAT